MFINLLSDYYLVMLLKLVEILRLKVIDNNGKVTDDFLSFTNAGNGLLLATG